MCRWDASAISTTPTRIRNENASILTVGWRLTKSPIGLAANSITPTAITTAVIITPSPLRRGSRPACTPLHAAGNPPRRDHHRQPLAAVLRLGLHHADGRDHAVEAEDHVQDQDLRDDPRERDRRRAGRAVLRAFELVVDLGDALVEE